MQRSLLERLEDDRVVEAIEELGREARAHGAHDCIAPLLRDRGVLRHVLHVRNTLDEIVQHSTLGVKTGCRTHCALRIQKAGGLISKYERSTSKYERSKGTLGNWEESGERGSRGREGGKEGKKGSTDTGRKGDQERLQARGGH